MNTTASCTLLTIESDDAMQFQLLIMLCVVALFRLFLVLDMLCGCGGVLCGAHRECRHDARRGVGVTDQNTVQTRVQT